MNRSRPPTIGLTHLVSDQRGVIVIQVGLALVVLLGFGAFAVDYGVLWVGREQAQNAADAGALAAATALAFDNMVDPARREVVEHNQYAITEAVLAAAHHDRDGRLIFDQPVKVDILRPA